MIALAGSTEVDLVVQGERVILKMGYLTQEIILTLGSLAFLSICLHYHIKGAFCLSLVITALLWWASQNSWPSSLVEFPSAEVVGYPPFDGNVLILVLDLLFLSLLTLNPLVSSLSEMGALTREDGTTPRSRWLFIICGLTTLLSGLLLGPVFLVSPESGKNIWARVFD